MPFPTLIFSGHAVQRMIARGVGEADVRGVLDVANTVETYPDDTPYPSALYLAFVSGTPLHVVAADDDAGRRTIVITVSEPDPDLWDATFRTRSAP